MSKFKIGPNTANKAAPGSPPATVEEFAAGAAMVQSQTGSRPPKPVRLNLDLDPETHRRLKIRAIESDTTIAQFVRELIVRELG
ncbi:CopG family transcriptional regulator [Burkholderia glumae]|uniref:ribbon-helix-helix domain-containing protein n=1 Tax=Burkholderia glumae TaxID=337 RepID=UPI0021519676|nr:CopG family transcriptional regulator [Burkholderia glumae]